MSEPIVVGLCRLELAQMGTGSGENWTWRDWTAGLSDLHPKIRAERCPTAALWCRYPAIEGVRFAYGHDQDPAALQINAEPARYRREHGDQAARAGKPGQAVSYRFKRDEKGWRMFAAIKTMEVPLVTDKRRGAIVVDLNPDHLAVCKTNPRGDCLNTFSVPLVTYGRPVHQAEAVIGDAVANVVQYAREIGKPIVIERLDSRQKNAALEGRSRKYSRMLSSFSYGKVKAYFLSRGHREGVEVHQVNPAFGSVIGRVKFMEHYGLGVHQATALTLKMVVRAHQSRPLTGRGHKLRALESARREIRHITMRVCARSICPFSLIPCSVLCRRERLPSRSTHAGG